jgi:DNA-binding NarL/FixJ family response regulator
MTHLLLFDHSAALVELVGRHLETEFGHRVMGLTDAEDLASFGPLAGGSSPDVLVAEPDGPAGDTVGLESILTFGRAHLETAIVFFTAAVDELRLSIAWDAVRPASAVSKRSPLRVLDHTLAAVVKRGSCPPDPALHLRSLPTSKPCGVDTCDWLVPHRGHAKLWQALLEAHAPPTYRTIADRTGLAVNTIRNYRDDLLAELANWGLVNPTMREMHEFAAAVGPLLRPVVETRLRPGLITINEGETT